MKNKMMRAAAILMVLTLMTSCFVGSTFAKYTSEAVGTAKATVAQWSIKAGKSGEETEIAGATTFAFNLFETIVDTVDGNADDEVAANLIAPGTKGQFTLSVKNDSEVDAIYSIVLAQDGTAIPLQYSLDGIDWDDDFTAINANAAMKDVVFDMNATKTVTVYWQWAFEEGTGHAAQTNAGDTGFGIAAQSASEEVTVTATLTATQVD